MQTYNIAQDLLRYLEINPNQSVFVGNINLRATEYAFAIRNFTANLQLKNVNAGDLIVLDIDDPPIALAITNAIALLGASWVALTPALIESNLNIKHIITNKASSKSTILMATGIYTDLNVIKVDQSWFNKASNFDLLEPFFETIPDQIWMIAQSSGSTGNVKFIPISYKNYWHRVWDYNNNLFNEHTQYYYCFYLPLKTSAIYHTINAILNNIPIIVENDPTKVINYPNLYCLGSVMHADKFVQKIKNLGKLINASLDVSGAAINKNMLDSWLHYFDRVYSSYGSTETSRNYLRFYDSIENFNTSMSQPFLENSAAEIVDTAGNILAAEQTGFIRFPRNDRHAGNYLMDIENSNRHFRHNCFYPGDQGFKDTAGNLYVVGRTTANMINIGGVKLNPVEIEQTINTIDSVTGCILFKNSNLPPSYQLSLLIVCNNLEKDLTDIVQKVATEFGLQAVPRTYFAMNNIPLNANGKPDRLQVMSLIQDLDPIVIDLD